MLRRGANSAADLAARQQTYRNKIIDGRRQQFAITHVSEHMAMHAVHKAEQDRLSTSSPGRSSTYSTVFPACGP